MAMPDEQTEAAQAAPTDPETLLYECAEALIQNYLLSVGRGHLTLEEAAKFGRAAYRVTEPGADR